MKCIICNTEMKKINLPSETHYQSTKRKTLYICVKCGNEKEVIGGDKCL